MAKKGTTQSGSSNAKLPELKRLKEKKKSDQDGRKRNGGPRPGAGRKPDPEIAKIELLKTRAIEHAFQKQEVVITTARGQKIVEMERDIALLDMLFTEAIRNKNVRAASEYFDRTRGKASQPVEMSGSLKVEDQYVPEEDPALQAAIDAYNKVAFKKHGNKA